MAPRLQELDGVSAGLHDLWGCSFKVWPVDTDAQPFEDDGRPCHGLTKVGNAIGIRIIGPCHRLICQCNVAMFSPIDYMTNRPATALHQTLMRPNVAFRPTTPQSAAGIESSPRQRANCDRTQTCGDHRCARGPTCLQRVSYGATAPSGGSFPWHRTRTCMLNGKNHRALLSQTLDRCIGLGRGAHVPTRGGNRARRVHP